MVATWLALEDIHPTAGPIHYYRGTHKQGLWDYVQLGLEAVWMNGNNSGSSGSGGSSSGSRGGGGGQVVEGRDFSRLDPIYEKDYPQYQDALQAEIRRLGLKPEYALLKKGEALIWAASLLHGGTRIEDTNRTRLSQASHYFIAPPLGEPQSYWVPSVSRYTAGRVRLKDRFGKALKAKSFAHPAGIMTTTSAATTGAATNSATAVARGPRGGATMMMQHPGARQQLHLPAPSPPASVNSYLPKGIRAYSVWERTRHDVATIWETNRTKFYLLEPWVQRRCRRPAPPKGALATCVGLNLSAITR